jgi:stage V sporulation protein AC
MNMAQPLEIQKKQYKKLVDEIKPRPPLIRNTLGAFIFGGLIALIGQFLLSFFQGQGLSVNDAGTATSATLIFLAALFTGLGIYDEIAKYGGAGTIVPITGFANSMVSPAMEYRTEGLVLGVGARLFTIAGPVLVFGIFSAWLVALLYYFFR